MGLLGGEGAWPQGLPVSCSRVRSVIWPSRTDAGRILQARRGPAFLAEVHQRVDRHARKGFRQGQSLPRWVCRAALRNPRFLCACLTQVLICCYSEVWTADVSELNEWLETMQHKFSVFDSPLVYNFSRLSKTEKADLRSVFDGALISSQPTKAVTCVQNHDTQAGQTVETPVEGFFKVSTSGGCSHVVPPI